MIGWARSQNGVQYRASSLALRFWFYKKNGVFTFSVGFRGGWRKSAKAGASICLFGGTDGISNGNIISSSARGGTTRINSSFIIVISKRACAGENLGVFSMAGHVAIRRDVDDDEAEMDMDGEDGVAECTRSTR